PRGPAASWPARRGGCPGADGHAAGYDRFRGPRPADRLDGGGASAIASITTAPRGHARAPALAALALGRFAPPRLRRRRPRLSALWWANADPRNARRSPGRAVHPCAP